jgi:hypothetical protein
MAVTAFHDFTLALRDREWDGAAAEKRVRAWADAQDKPTPGYRDAHIWCRGPGQLFITTARGRVRRR